MFFLSLRPMNCEVQTTCLQPSRHRMEHSDWTITFLKKVIPDSMVSCVCVLDSVVLITAIQTSCIFGIIFQEIHKLWLLQWKHRTTLTFLGHVLQSARMYRKPLDSVVMIRAIVKLRITTIEYFGTCTYYGYYNKNTLRFWRSATYATNCEDVSEASKQRCYNQGGRQASNNFKIVFQDVH